MFSKRLNKWKFQCPLNLLIKCNFGQLNSLLVAHSDCQPTLGTSLVVQCLLPLQRGMGLIPGQGTEILHDFTVWPKVSKIKWNGETKKKERKKTNFVVSFQVTWQSFWRKWLYNISPKASNAAICSLCAWQNTAGWECGKQLWMLCPWTGCWRNTEKWVHFAVVTVLTSEFPPPSFKSQHQFGKWMLLLISSRIIKLLNYYVKLLYYKC